MENEILQQILSEIADIKVGQQRADVRMDGLQQQIADTRDGLQQQIADTRDGLQQQIADTRDGLQQQINDQRQGNILFEHNITQRLGAMEDSQQIIIDMARELMKLAHETREMLDDHKSEQTAIAATLMLHEQRITHLEKQAV